MCSSSLQRVAKKSTHQPSLSLAAQVGSTCSSGPQAAPLGPDLIEPLVSPRRERMRDADPVDGHLIAAARYEHLRWHWVAHAIQHPCMGDCEASAAKSVGDEDVEAAARHGLSVGRSGMNGLESPGRCVLLLYIGGMRSGGEKLLAINSGADGHTAMRDATLCCADWGKGRGSLGKLRGHYAT
jgi:hypothetical protein